MKTAIIFPGQGSQFVGMAKELHEKSTTIKEIFKKADKVLGYSISKLMFEGPIEELTLTKNNQPAILLASISAWIQLDMQSPVACAGHSLGEYSALVAAGSISLEDAVLLVHKRGLYMQEAVPSGTGTMAAVINMEIHELENRISNFTKKGCVEIANINSPGQIVIAGMTQSIETFSELLKADGKKIIPLNVSTPFHCSLMRPARDKFAKDLELINISIPQIPFYSNTDGKQVASPEKIKRSLLHNICGTVLWTEVITNLQNAGIEAFVECGPGTVLSKLLKRTSPEVKRFNVSNPEEIKMFKPELCLSETRV